MEEVTLCLPNLEWACRKFLIMLDTFQYPLCSSVSFHPLLAVLWAWTLVLGPWSHCKVGRKHLLSLEHRLPRFKCVLYVLMMRSSPVYMWT